MTTTVTNAGDRVTVTVSEIKTRLAWKDLSVSVTFDGRRLNNATGNDRFRVVADAVAAAVDSAVSKLAQNPDLVLVSNRKLYERGLELAAEEANYNEQQEDEAKRYSGRKR